MLEGLFHNLMFSALGIGWNVAKTDDADEDDFIEQAHLSVYDQRADWIGGTSNDPPGSRRSPVGLTDDGNGPLLISYLVVRYHFLTSQKMVNILYQSIKKQIFHVYRKVKCAHKRLSQNL